jgi:hypothetical protein
MLSVMDQPNQNLPSQTVNNEAGTSAVTTQVVGPNLINTQPT